MRILLIGNPGSFFKESKRKLSLSFDVDAYCVDRERRLSILSDFSNNQGFWDFEKYIAIVYISGETRNKEFMGLLNFELPSILADISCQNNMGFVYLSSLAVFAGCVEDLITVKSEFKPIDDYGKTKALFDHHISKLEKIYPGSRVKTIFPASFYSKSGRSSIEKFGFYKQKFSKIFNIVSLQGCLSYVDRDDVIDKIVVSLKREDYRAEIMAKHYELKDENSKFTFPKPPLLLFKIIGKVFPRISVKMRMLLRGVYYK